MLDYQDIPVNGFAYQETRNGGNGYMGLITTNNDPTQRPQEFREYLQTKLSLPLKKNKKYCAGMYTNLAFDALNGQQNIVRATKDLGILFTKDRVLNTDATFSSYIIHGTPQVKATHYLRDTLNWECMTNIVVGNGEQWLTVGVFKPDWQADDSLVYEPTGITALRTYYFIDDVFVIPMENEEALLLRIDL